MVKTVSRARAQIHQLAADGWSTTRFSTALRRAVGRDDALPAGSLPKPDAYLFDPEDTALTVAVIALSRVNVLADWLPLWMGLDDRAFRLDVVRIDEAGRRHVVSDGDFVAGYHASCRGLDIRASALAAAEHASVEGQVASLLLALPPTTRLDPLIRSGSLEQVELGPGNATRVATSSIARLIVQEMRSTPDQWRLHGERIRRFAHYERARDWGSQLPPLHPDRRVVDRETLASIGVLEAAWQSTPMSATLSSGASVGTADLERALLHAEHVHDEDDDLSPGASEERPVVTLYVWAYDRPNAHLSFAAWCATDQ